ncbi:unnamed protein product [Ilex paraguariensis]|uniref:Transmembrane protein n=1 Tax=Ilex paraguariensis TaxID=185542 RepID=A0ABC8UW43_9AQUA
MEEEREGDIRVPLISALFCLFVISGGVFLVVYVYVPNLSEPWFPMAAFLLIGSPWIFWFLTYIYTCIKACFRRTPVDDRQISRRGSLATPPPPKTANTAVLPSNDEPPENSPKDGRHVHFGEAAVVVKGEDSGGQNGEHGGGEESSVNYLLQGIYERPYHFFWLVKLKTGIWVLSLVLEFIT